MSHWLNWQKTIWSTLIESNTCGKCLSVEYYLKYVYTLHKKRFEHTFLYIKHHRTKTKLHINAKTYATEPWRFKYKRTTTTKAQTQEKQTHGKKNIRRASTSRRYEACMNSKLYIQKKIYIILYLAWSYIIRYPEYNFFFCTIRNYCCENNQIWNKKSRVCKDF